VPIRWQVGNGQGAADAGQGGKCGRQPRGNAAAAAAAAAAATAAAAASASHHRGRQVTTNLFCLFVCFLISNKGIPTDVTSDSVENPSSASGRFT